MATVFRETSRKKKVLHVARVFGQNTDGAIFKNVHVCEHCVSQVREIQRAQYEKILDCRNRLNL